MYTWREVQTYQARLLYTNPQLMQNILPRVILRQTYKLSRRLQATNTNNTKYIYREVKATDFRPWKLEIQQVRTILRHVVDSKTLVKYSQNNGRI